MKKQIEITGLTTGFVYFLLLLAVALFVDDVPYQTNRFISIDQMAGWHPFLDPVTFSLAAIDVYEGGWLTEKNAWIFTLWPPGFVFLESLVFKIVGRGGPFLLVLQILSCVALAAMLSAQRFLLRRVVGQRAAFLLPLIPFVFVMPRVFLLEPFGVVLGESFAVAFFMLGEVLILLAGASRHGFALASVAGLLFAASAYFRSQYEALVVVGTGTAVPLVLLLWWTARRSTDTDFRADRIAMIRVVAVALIVANLAMAPWRIHNYLTVGNIKWVQTSTLIFQNGLRSDKALAGIGGQFVIDGGGNMACRVEPSYCDQLDPKLFLRAFLAHPLEWYTHKLSYLGTYWSTFRKPTRPTFSAWYFADEAVSYWINLLALLATVPLLLVVRAYRWWPILAWSLVTMGMFYVGIVTFAHLEPRYFYLLKIFSLFNCTHMLALWWQSRTLSRAST